MEVMIPAHLHLETACLEGTLHFREPAFSEGLVKGHPPHPPLAWGRDARRWGGRHSRVGTKGQMVKKRAGAEGLARYMARLLKRGGI